ncbi:hypothetical protein [Oceanobacillus piezotolerans]|nr:hypothetical protein [Oceanobacillus piezotolerans]
MKASEEESKRFDKALDEFIDLFNNLESDVPVVQFTEEVLEKIEKAMEQYGVEVIEERINKVVEELLSWLELNEEK